MKTKTLFSLFAVATALTTVPLRAEEAKPGMKCPECKKMEEAKKPGADKKDQAGTAELDKLVNEMNASTGDKKIAAISAIINLMAQKHKEAPGKPGGMMMMGMKKKDGKPDAIAGAVDYYTCKMHPEVHWPIPGKCPLCSMDLVPVAKKDAGAKPGAEPKKADDPHAGHSH